MGARTLVGLIMATTGLFAFSSAAGGQDAEGEVDAVADDTLVVFGTLAVAGEGVGGVTIQIRSADGVSVGEATTDDAGDFSIPVPGDGTYEAELVTDTLPEGVRLEDADRAVLDRVLVFPGRDKRIAFALAEGGSGDDATGDDPADVAGDAATSGNSGGGRFANLLWSGVKLGLVIALTSIGLSLIFSTTGLVNFAHGELVTMGALFTWLFNSPSVGLGWPLPFAAVAGVVITAAFGGALQGGLWRPLGNRVGLVSLMIVSIGLGLFLRHVYAVIFNASPRPFAQYGAQSPWKWGPLTFPPKDLWLVGVCVVALALTVLALERTRLGTAVRAVSDNRDLAESSGINVERVVVIVWVAGAGLAGLGGVIFGLSQAVQWDMGYRLLLVMFAAVILGGLGSVYGPILGGLLIGVVSELSTLWFPAEFKLAWALAVLILVLLVRPQGIIGVRERIG